MRVGFQGFVVVLLGFFQQETGTSAYVVLGGIGDYERQGFLGLGRYNFLKDSIYTLKEYFQQTKTYYANFALWFFSKNMNELNFHIDFYNRLMCLDLEVPFDYSIVNEGITKIIESDNTNLEMGFSKEEIDQLSIILSFIIFTYKYKEQIDKDILIEIANVQLLDNDIIIYFGYQAKSIAEGLLNLKGIKYPILWPQRNLDEIIGEYYESRLSYGEKFLEDQSEDIS